MSAAVEVKREGRLRELDGWRAVSVLLVIVDHFFWFHYPQLMPHSAVLRHMINYTGAVGVKTFFVISGFVICRLLIAEEQRFGSVSLKGFYYRRIFRILPPFYLYLATISLLLFFGLIHENWAAILTSGLFLANIHFLLPSWFVDHTWSLAVEEQFYLTFPAMWVLTRPRWRSRVFIGVVCLCVLWNLSLAFHGWTHSLIQTGTRAGFATICFGVLMAIHEERLRRMAAKIPVIVVILVAIMLMLRPVPYGTWMQALYDGLIFPPAIGLVLLYSLERGATLRAILCSKPMQAIGLTSYGIYLWQQLFTAPAEYYAGIGQISPLFLPLLFVVVPFSYIVLEKPAMRYGKALSKRTREQTPVRTTVSS
jgi:peptidoglycan/LPS O-acetylase OafA/YrhL